MSSQLMGRNRDVALFLPALAGGGAERVTLLLAEGFIARGLSLDLVLGVKEGPYVDRIPAGVRVIELHSRRPVGKLVALARYLRQERPATLLSALDNVNLSTCARRLARVSTRTVLGVHNTMSVDLQGAAGLKARARRLLLRSLYRSADAIVAVSHGVATDLIQYAGLPRSHVHVIYNPVVTQTLLTMGDEHVDHPWMLDVGRVPVVLAVGRLVPQKDFPTLLRAFAIARRQGPCRLVVLGEGAERSRLEQLAAALGLTDDVAFCGFVANPYAWMSKSRVLVMSSEWEGLPTVLIEALALGTPVVSTDCPSGPREILDDGRFGMLVPVGDATRLGAAIASTLRAAVDSALLRRRGLSFSVDDAVERYIRALFQTPASVNASESHHHALS